MENRQVIVNASMGQVPMTEASVNVANPENVKNSVSLAST